MDGVFWRAFEGKENFKGSQLRTRVSYFIISIAVVILGLLSRSSIMTRWVPLSIGDLLYATLLYFLISTLLPTNSKFTRALLALVWCIIIEILQLVDSGILHDARQTLLGRLILGQGFLWSDFIFYAAGTFVGVVADIRIISWFDKKV